MILITGASRGIGAFAASLLAQQGHSIIINYVNNDQESNAVMQKIQEVDNKTIDQLLAVDVKVPLYTMCEAAKRLASWW